MAVIKERCGVPTPSGRLGSECVLLVTPGSTHSKHKNLDGVVWETPAPIQLEIVWQSGRYNVQRGVVGNFELFTLTSSTSRLSPGWELTTDLPGLVRNHKSADEETGKTKAADLLAAWLRGVGVNPSVGR